MPLTRISMVRGKSASYRASVVRGLYEAMRQTFDVPEDDLFVVIHEVEPENLAYGKTYLGIERSGDLVIVQVTCNNTRSVEQKKAFYAAACANLVADPGLRPEDLFINLVEAERENWSFGHGLAQYA